MMFQSACICWIVFIEEDGDVDAPLRRDLHVALLQFRVWKWSLIALPYF